MGLGIRDLEQAAATCSPSNRVKAGDTSVYSRREAVQLQLEMAVRARLQHNDLVSALTLAGAAERVLSDLQPKEAKTSEGYTSLKAHINEVELDPKKRKGLADCARKDYDQLRHAHPLLEHTHGLSLERVDALLTLSIEAFQPRTRNADIMEWLHELPPILGSFWFFATLSYPMAERKALENDQSASNALAMVEKWKRSPDKCGLYEELLGIIQSKSLIPNPKSLTNPSTAQ